MGLTEFLKSNEAHIRLYFHMTSSHVRLKQLVQEPGSMPIRRNFKLTDVGELAFGIETRCDMSSPDFRICKSDRCHSIGALKNGRKHHSLRRLTVNLQTVELITLNVAEGDDHPGR